MIYITGDMHGDISRFKSREVRKLKKGDYLIVCGDFGFLWNDSKGEKRLLQWIGKRRYNILFVEGTHDNLDLINEYPITDWQGGKVHEISGRLKHLIRGEIFELEGKKVFAFGGGSSDEREIRQSANMWWSGELPTPQEIDAARHNLELHNNKVDYIVTHQCSLRIRQFLVMDHNDANVLDTFLDEVREKVKYTRWFFGCAHLTKIIPPSEVALFKAVVSAAEQKPY